MVTGMTISTKVFRSFNMSMQFTGFVFSEFSTWIGSVSVIVTFLSLMTSGTSLNAKFTSLLSSS